MKPAALILAASLLANVTLVAVLVTRPSTRDRGTRPTATSGPLPAGSLAVSDALRAALASGDAAALAAAGVNPDVARDLALGRTLARIADRARHAPGQAAADDRWWRNRTGTPGARAEQLVARRELSAALLAAFGTDLGLAGGEVGLLAFLPSAKRDALRRITQDYDEMFAAFATGGPQLASDKEKLRLLRAERERDIAALLTPEEREAYDLRTSPSGMTVRNRYGDAIESEAELAKTFALQKAFDEKFPREAMTGRIAPETIRARSEAERQLDQDLRTAVGDARYAALRRAADPDLRTVDALVARLSLPPATADNVVATREAFAAESQRINQDAAVPMPQRRAQIQELAGRAKTELTRALGNEAADAYAQTAPWLNFLQSGMAYSTAPQAGTPGSLMGGQQSVYPVMPAGASAPGSGRSMFISSAPPVELSAGGDRALTNPNVQMMTFSTSTTETATAPAISPGQTRTGIAVPSPTAAPAPTPTP
ncbi:hypothetical protein [Horticoccus sp. 23ND18S-11]|uniref:hypothetical protein n=1 Tax=Horticoccus sp. 23ND18S-11 TaxID=3391832 RepID=UPI0039C8E815